MIYPQLFQALFLNNIHYLICGGLAVNIYGIPRMTADIDLLLNLTPNNITQFENTMNKLNYKPLIPLSLQTLQDEKTRTYYIKERNLIGYSYFNSQKNFVNIDILLDLPISFQSMWENKEIRTIDNYQIYLISIQHLIELKNYSNRIQDQKDIQLLNQIQTKNDPKI